MSRKETRFTVACDMCRGSSKPGYLWLGGKDYVECPQCGGDQKTEIIAQLHTPATLFAVGAPRLMTTHGHL